MAVAFATSNTKTKRFAACVYAMYTLIHTKQTPHTVRLQAICCNEPHYTKRQANKVNNITVC